MVDDTGTLPPSEGESEYSSYIGKKEEGVTFKDIVLRSLEACRLEWSKEMTKGGQKQIFSKELNDWVVVSIPDQRRICEQVTKTLYDLLFFYFDKEAKDSIDKAEKEMKEAYPKFLAEYLKHEHWMPYIEDSTHSGIIMTGPASNVGYYYVQAYEDFIVESWRRIYRALILLFKRKNELSNKRTQKYD